jgi:hypothetical protein
MSGEKDFKTQKGIIMYTIINMALTAISRMAENIPTEGINEIYDDSNNIIGYQHGCASTFADNHIIISTCGIYDEVTHHKRGVCNIVSVDAVTYEPHTLTIHASEYTDTELFSVSMVTGELGNLNDTEVIKHALKKHVDNIFSI